MESIRQRASEMFPSVMLTVLSMIQALALELLWSRIVEDSFLWAGGWDAVLGWAELLAALLGILEIWLFYMSSVLRFTWVPSIYDSVLPFGIGMIEFSMIELIGPGTVAPWLLSVALLFGVSTWAGQQIARRARQIPSNEGFFAKFKPATRRDFLPAVLAVGALVVLAAVIYALGELRSVSFVAVCGVLALILRQLEVTRNFWNSSLSDPTSTKTDSEAKN